MKMSTPKLLWACIGTLVSSVILTVVVMLLFLSHRWPVLRMLTAIRMPLLFSVLLAIGAGWALARYAATVGEASARFREERLRRFLNDTGHEMRTPLAVFSSSLGVLRSCLPPLTGTAAAMFNAIEQESARLSQLIHALLLLARLDAIRPPARDEVPLLDLMNEVIAEMGALHNIDIQASVGMDLSVRMARAELREVLVNLFDNAARHAKGAQVRVDASRDKNANIVMLVIADDGPGMPIDDCRLAFEPFFRGDAARDKPGSGLGLSIVRSAIERTGGTVHLQSSAGSGVTITLELPTP